MENHDIIQFEHHYNPIFHTQIFKIKLAQKFNLQIYTTIYSNYHLFETNIKAILRTAHKLVLILY